MPVADGMWDVDVPINATFDELHVVLGQSAGFIREHILHLKKKTTGVFVKIIFIYLLQCLLLCQKLISVNKIVNNQDVVDLGHSVL